MIFKFAWTKHLLCVVAGAVLLLASSVSNAENAEAPEVEARRLVHVLGYVAADYSGAVSGGAITNADEYQEQLELLGEANKIALRIQPALAAKSTEPGQAQLNIGEQVVKVRSLVEKKADAGLVNAEATALKASLITAFRLSESPDKAPSAERGKALYTEHCVSCHGELGNADTPKARTYTPRPANFLDPQIGEGLSPFRVSTTVRFGVQGTAMVPFTFLSEAEQWDLAFYVTGLRHSAEPADGTPNYALSELSVRSDGELRKELLAAGVAESRVDAVLSDLRKRAPFEDRAARAPLSVARAKLDRARIFISRGDRELARAQLIDAYLEGIEPAEPALRASNPALAAEIEAKFRDVRLKLEERAGADEINAHIAGILKEITRAEALLDSARGNKSFMSTAISSAGILLREGVEAALLIAALLGVAVQAGLGDRKRFVHLGWAVAIGLGLLTWLFSAKLIAISGAKRELIEGVTALLATGVLFYVSYSLLAKREVARWMKFLRGKVTSRGAALSLFLVALLAAYREAFETVLFYQALLASDAPKSAALAGAGVGALLLVLLVAVYTRAGKFAPPAVFFRISSYLLYVMAIIFAGQGVFALQLAGLLPLHPVSIPQVPALGIYASAETLIAQAILILLAVAALIIERGSEKENGANKAAPPVQSAS